MNCLFEVLNTYGMLRQPWRIWNADETGIKLGEAGGKTKVLAARGARRVYSVASSDSRHVSLIFAVSAAGVCSPATFILPCGKTPTAFWDAIGKLREDEWSTVCEKKGFITEVSFYDWLKLFVQFLDENVRKGNVGEHHLLIVDQASAHVSGRILEYCQQHNVLLYMLPAHTTHLTQPVDVGIFGPMKNYYHQAEHELIMRRSEAWQRMCSTFLTTVEARQPLVPPKVTLTDIPALIHKALRLSCTKENIYSAFRATGIHPFDDQVLLRQLPKGTAADAPPADEEDSGPAADEDIAEADGDPFGDDEDELRTALETEETDAMRCPRKPTTRRPNPKTPYVGLMRLKDFRAAAKAAEAKNAGKEHRAKQRKQRREEKVEEKRVRDAAAAARRAAPAESDARKAAPAESGARRARRPKNAAKGARRKGKLVIAGGSSAVRVTGRRTKADANSRNRLKRSVGPPARYREEEQ
jgi:hypothetical protein